MGDIMHGIVDYIKDNQFRILIFDNKIDIVNYDKLLAMTSDRVSVLNQNKRIVIRGNDLTVRKLLNREILVVGTIACLEFEA